MTSHDVTPRRLYLGQCFTLCAPVTPLCFASSLPDFSIKVYNDDSRAESVYTLNNIGFLEETIQYYYHETLVIVLKGSF